MVSTSLELFAMEEKAKRNEVGLQLRGKTGAAILNRENFRLYDYSSEEVPGRRTRRSVQIVQSF